MKTAKDITRRLLANPVYEEYSIQIEREGRKWAQTGYCYFNGKKWIGRNGRKKPKPNKRN